MKTNKQTSLDVPIDSKHNNDAKCVIRVTEYKAPGALSNKHYIKSLILAQDERWRRA